MHDSGTSGKLTGEGSHFGTGGTGTDSAGYSLGKDTEGHGFSAAEPTGNTDSAGYAIAQKSGDLGTRQEGNHPNPTSNASALRESEGTGQTGQAAVGETSTYSSHPLSTGDKTSSVVDPTSPDTNTFRRPEASSSAGVGPNAAEIAARRAFEPSSGRVPGEFPEDTQNPYATSHLDPRVDSAGHAPVSQSHTGRDAALGAGAGAAGVGAYEATRSHEPSTATATAPSTLTSTTDPTERSPGYGSANESRGLDSATPATTSTPATTTADSSTEKKGVVGTVLGALGLGGGAAAAKHEHDKDSALDSSPSTTTGVDSYRSPSQSGPPPSHHRKESIPTTAYPSGNLESVRPIAGPTGQAPTQATSDSHLGRDAAIGAGAIGATGLGAHEYEKSREPTSGPADSKFQSGMAGTSSAAPNKSTVYDMVTGDSPQTSQPSAGDSHHYGRDAAIGGGAVGAAALGAHEYEKTTGRAPAEVPSEVTPTSQQYGNQPITSQGAKDFSNKVDPRTDVAGDAHAGTGVGAVPTGTSGQPEEQHHYGRDAAVVGGGAAATGVAAHEVDEHDAEKAEKQHAKLQKKQHKEIEKEEKAHEKELKQEQKAEEKAEKKHEKEVAKEEKRHEKELAKDHKRHEEEGAAAVGAGAVGAGAYEAEKHHEPSSGTGGLTAADAADREAYNKQNRYTSTMADPGADPTVRKPSVTAGAGTTEGTHGTDPYYTRHPVPDSAIAGQPTDSTVGTDGQHHYGRDAAIGGAGAAAIGGTAYEAEKHHDQGITGSNTGTGQRTSGLATADETDKRANTHHDTHHHEKKPSLFKRIFKRKKNVHTGESEDDEDNYEDVPHDHGHPDTTLNQGLTSGTVPSSSGSPATTHPHPHEQGELTKPSYNPFKKEDPNVKAVEGRI